MKLKALKSFYLQRLKAVVNEGQEFETTDPHGNELIQKGMAVFIKDSEIEEESDLSDYEQALIKEHTEALQASLDAKSAEVLELNSSISEKDTEITALKATIAEKDAEITKLSAGESKTVDDDSDKKPDEAKTDEVKADEKPKKASK